MRNAKPGNTEQFCRSSKSREDGDGGNMAEQRRRGRPKELEPLKTLFLLERVSAQTPIAGKRFLDLIVSN